MTPIQKDLRRLLTKGAAYSPVGAFAPPAPARAPGAIRPGMSQQEKTDWLTADRKKHTPMWASAVNAASRGVGKTYDKVVGSKPVYSAVNAIGDAGDAAVRWTEREDAKGWFGHTRNSTGLGKIPGLATDIVRAPMNLIGGGAVKLLSGSGRAGDIFWNGSDGNSNNLLWRAGAKAVNNASDVVSNSSFSSDGLTKRAPVVSSDNDATFWRDTLGAGLNFGGATLDGFGAAAPFAGGLVTAPARGLLSRTAQGVKTVAMNAAKTTGAAAGIDATSSALGLKNEPLEVSPEAAAAYEQNQGNAYGPTGQPFDPASLSNLLAFLLPYLQQGQGGQGGYPDPRYMSAIDRAGDNIRE